MDRTIQILQEHLTRAAAAHGIHEQEELGGVYDEQWPEWYAAYMARTLREEGIRLEIDETHPPSVNG